MNCMDEPPYMCIQHAIIVEGNFMKMFGSFANIFSHTCLCVRKKSFDKTNL